MGRAMTEKDTVVIVRGCPEITSMQCNGDPDGMLGDGTEQCRVEWNCSSREAELRQYIARHLKAGHPIDLQCDIFIFFVNKFGLYHRPVH